MGTVTHAVVDGAERIRSQHGIHLSRLGRAISDSHHVCEYLSAAFPDAADCQRHKALLPEERIEDTLAELGELAGKERADRSGDAPAADALRHLTNRRDSLFYAQAREQGLPIGSGLIEGAHRHALQARLKISGAWWKPGQRQAPWPSCASRSQMVSGTPYGPSQRQHDPITLKRPGLSSDQQKPLPPLRAPRIQSSADLTSSACCRPFDVFS